MTAYEKAKAEQSRIWNEKARTYQKASREVETRAAAVDFVNDIITDNAEGQISNEAFRTLLTLIFWKGLLTRSEYENIKKGLGA